MAVNIANLPEDAVEQLFVDDLIKWMLHRHGVMHCEIGKVERYRTFIYNIFNEDVKQAVRFIDTSMEPEINEHFSALPELSENSFIDYAVYCEEIHFEKEFQADCFLQYCVRLLSMATKFVLCNVPQTIRMSRVFILQLLEERGIFEGGWYAFSKVAGKYTKIFQDYLDVDTPETSDEETAAQNLDETLAVSSEDESPIQISEDESPVYSSDEHQTHSSSGSSDMNEGTQTCHFVSDRDQLQKTKREFKTGDLLAAREILQPDRLSKAANNSDSNTGQALEVTSPIYELLPSTSKKV